MSKDLTASLQALTEGANNQTTRKDKILPAAKAVSPIPARTGSSPPITGPVSGIASPLVEVDYDDREFHSSAVLVKSMDELYSLLIYPVKKITFEDALGATVIMEYKAPT